MSHFLFGTFPFEQNKWKRQNFSTCIGKQPQRWAKLWRVHSPQDTVIFNLFQEIKSFPILQLLMHNILCDFLLTCPNPYRRPVINPMKLTFPLPPVPELSYRMTFRIILIGDCWMTITVTELSTVTHMKNYQFTPKDSGLWFCSVIPRKAWKQRKVRHLKKEKERPEKSWKRASEG